MDLDQAAAAVVVVVVAQTSQTLRASLIYIGRIWMIKVVTGEPKDRSETALDEDRQPVLGELGLLDPPLGSYSRSYYPKRGKNLAIDRRPGELVAPE